MSGPHQRPSNGSNIREQHAMNPAKTGGDPANHVFNDQTSSINGRLHQGNNMQMQHQTMMGVQQQQPNQMASYNLGSEGSTGRLPPLTLKSSTFTNSNTVLLSNGTQCHLQPTSMSMSSNGVQQMHNRREYDQNTLNKVSPPMHINEQLFDQHSLNSQQEMENPIRINTPMHSHQHLDQQNMHQMVFNQQNQQPQNPYNGQNDMLQNQLSLNQFQSGHQTGNKVVSSFQTNQNPEQVSHLGHMDQQPPTQHSMNSVPQSQTQQRVGQMGCNLNQMGVQSQVQSPTSSNLSMSMSSSTSSFSITPPMKNSSSISPNSIPNNANSTTQLIMALNNNSPITQEQLQEIQSMTTVAQDGTEILLMQEPRLKQYSGIKDMSTTDLRLECKKRALPSAGTKVRLCERLGDYEKEIIDERNNKLMQEYNHRQQMYETQAAALKAFQAKKAALLQAQNRQNGNGNNSTNCSSNTSALLMTPTKPADGPPPKRKRVSKPKKQQQQNMENQTNQPQNVMSMGSNQVTNMLPTSENGTTISTDIDVLLGRNTNQSNVTGNMMNTSQNGSNVFGGQNQTGTSRYFVKDNSCFSHLDSGCRLISNNSNDETEFGSTGRTFQVAVPPPPSGNSQIHYQSNDQLLYGVPDQVSNQRNDTQSQQQSRPINLNQQQHLGGKQNMNQSITTMFNVSTPSSMQQQQQQGMTQSNQNFMNGTVTQKGLQASPCVADQAGPSPNMPVSDPTATTSGSPIVVSSAVDSSEAAELMDLETMQKLLSPATLRAREELLTQQQSQINELVKLIQSNHDTLREQQQQINLAKKQQKQRQRQASQNAIVIDKHVNSRCIQHAIKSRQNLQILNELTQQQDSIRTAETRLIEQLHINTATDDIARLIKQDGRTALVIVSLLHDYRTTREQNNRAKSTNGEPNSVEDKKNVEVVAKKKAPARKRTNNGTPKSNQNKKSAQGKQIVEIDVSQVMSPPNSQPIMIQQQPLKQGMQQFIEFPKPQPPPRVRTQSDVDMEAIFKTVIDASRTNNKNPENQQQLSQHQQQQYDNEVISLPSEVSSPMRAQSQNSVQSIYSDGSYTRTMNYQQEESPQQMSYTMGTETESSCSPNDVQIIPNEIIQQEIQNEASQQPEIVEILPHIERTSIDYELDNHQYHETMVFDEDSNQEYIDTCQNNRFDSDFPDIDQMVANMRDSDPLNCPLDDIDLNAILNCWSDDCDSKQISGNQVNAANVNGVCSEMSYNPSGSMNEMSHFNEDMDWNSYSTQSDIINQAFEQS
uniref:SAP domain-containing protein n=1 Tax=Caenorhabditis tropicalis TaxID=1561998 RepID=A0A1I7U3Y0_9PELO